jgi:hypothetical protein
MVKIARLPRRSPRVRHDSVLEILDDSGRLLDGVARIIDVSSVGVCFSTTHRFAKGEKITARLRLMDAGVLQITGRVIRVKEKTNSTVYAVEFDSVKDARP